MTETRRIRIDFEYLGTRYAGWQWQDNALSIQQVVEEALEKIVGVKARVTASGRTDAGVHAMRHPAHADVATRLSDDELLSALNALLPDDITAQNVTTVSGDWSARYSAIEKTYVYTILNRRLPSAHDHGRVWHVRNTLDVDAMREAAKALVGEHDFTSFQSAGCAARNPVRTLKRLDIGKDGGHLRITLTGDGFLKQMVRNIVGTLAEVGRGKLETGDVAKILDARDRKKAGPCAPAEGLCLVNVVY